MNYKTSLTNALLALFLTFTVNMSTYAGTTSNPPVSFGDFVWNDLNGDGFQGFDEPGLSGVEVRLCGTSNGSGVDCNRLDIFETTDINGNYLFSGFGNVEEFRVEILTNPFGFSPTTPTSILFDNTLGQLDSQIISSADFGFQAVVPVPAAVWLFGSGLLGLIGIARRKHSI